MHTFYVCNDGLITTPDLRKFVLKHWHFKNLFAYWKYATLYDGDNKNQSDPYWETNQTVQQLNDNYKKNFEHG